MTSKKTSLFKIIVIGDYAVGKTSLIRRYTQSTFSTNYKLTIGVDFALKDLQHTPNHEIKLQLWDIAGHERHSSMSHVFFKHAIACICVYDVTRPGTKESVVKWKHDVDSKVRLSSGENIPAILFANKSDLLSGEVNLDDIEIEEELDLFCKEHGFTGWELTSAKEDVGIDGGIERLKEAILGLEEAEHPEPPKGIDIELESSGGRFENEREKRGSRFDNDERSSACCEF